jgi:hypothetical protein
MYTIKKREQGEIEKGLKEVKEHRNKTITDNAVITTELDYIKVNSIFIRRMLL